MITVNYTIFANHTISKENIEITESHPMRHFSIPEIDLLAKLTGFEIIKTEEFLSGAIPSKKTWGVCFILKKISEL